MNLTPIIGAGICFAVTVACFLAGALHHFHKPKCDFVAPLLAYNYSDNSFGLFLGSVNLVHPRTGNNVTVHTAQHALKYNLDGVDHSHTLHSDKLAYKEGTCECIASRLGEEGALLGIYGREVLIAQCTEELCLAYEGEAFFHCISKHQALLEDGIRAKCNLNNETQSEDYDYFEKDENIDTECISEAVLTETMAQFRAPLKQ